MVHTCTAQKVGLAIKALVEHGVVQNNGRLAPLPAWAWYVGSSCQGRSGPVGKVAAQVPPDKMGPGLLRESHSRNRA
jgi:hypothetical protein